MTTSATDQLHIKWIRQSNSFRAASLRIPWTTSTSSSQTGQDRQMPPRSFKGCWTCRDRRVKCDEQKPACDRCHRSGLPCQGYGVRLSWSSTRQYQGTTETKRAAGREHGRVSPPVFQFLRQSSQTRTPVPIRDDITQVTPQHLSPNPTCDSTPIFAALCGSTYLGEETSVDPAESIFLRQSQSPHSLCWLWGTFSAVSQHEVYHPGDLSTFGWDGLEPSPTVPTVDACGLRTNELQGTALLTSSTITWDDMSESLPSQENQSEKARSRTPTLRHIDFLSMPSRQKNLIFHWVTFLSGKLMLTDGPDNGLKTAMLPRALAGVCGSSTQSTPEIAIFHAICAGSAFNLFELSDRRDSTLESLALNHEALGLEHLRFCLAGPDVTQSHSLGPAILASIVVDAVSGTKTRWKTHLSGGISYLKHIQRQGRLADDHYEFSANLLRMALLSHWDISGERNLALDSFDLDDANCFSGARSPLFANLATMARFEGFTNVCPSTNELDKFELQLYLSFPPGQGSQKINPDPSAAAAATHAARAFYYASLVHFQRRIRKTSPDAVCSLVDIGLQELEAIQTATSGTAGVMVLWPALVLGAEAATDDLKARVTTWFQTKEAFGIRNVHVIHDLIKDLWVRRAYDNTLAWQDLVVEERYDVFRL